MVFNLSIVILLVHQLRILLAKCTTHTVHVLGTHLDYLVVVDYFVVVDYLVVVDYPVVVDYLDLVARNLQ